MTETRTVQIRNVPADVHERFTRGAQARGMTMAQYLENLIALHERSMMASDAETPRALLMSLGLGPVYL